MFLRIINSILIMLMSGSLYAGNAITPVLTNYYDDFPQLSDNDLINNKNSLEWWYFDIESDNSKLVLIFQKKNRITSGNDSSIYVEYIYACEGDYCTYNKVIRLPFEEFAFSEIESEGKAVIKISEANILTFYKDNNDLASKYHIVVNTGEFKADLIFFPIHQGFKPNNDGSYFWSKDDPDKYSSVNFAAPRMTGTGYVSLNGVIDNLEGEGYHDHPWATDDFFNSHGEWHWGKFYSEDYTVMYAKVYPSKGYNGEEFFIYFADRDSFIPQIETDIEVTASEWERNGINIKYPRTLNVYSPALDLTLVINYQEVLQDSPIYNRSQVVYVMEKSGTEDQGAGWTEYYKVNYCMRGFFRIIAILDYFTNWR